MSDALNQLGEVVARGVQPLIDQITADVTGEQLVRQLGFLTESVPAIVATLPAAAGALGSALQDLDAARDAVSSGNGPQSAVDDALLEVFGAVLAVAASVKTIGAGAPELPGFEDQFYELVLVSAAETLRPTLAVLLYFLGIFTRTVGTIVEDGENVTVVTKGVRFDRIGTALKDLPGLFEDVYGWGTATIDTADLFSNAAALANTLGLPFRLEYPADEALTSFGITVTDESQLPQQLAIPLGVFDLGEIDLDVFAVPTTSPTDVQALAFVLEVTAGGDQTLEISGQTTLTISANGSVDSGVGMIWRPGSTPQLTGNVLGSGVPSAQGTVSVELARTGFVPPDADQAEEQTIVSVGGGSSLTAQTLKVGAGVTVGGGKDDVSVSASLVGGHASILSFGRRRLSGSNISVCAARCPFRRSSLVVAKVRGAPDSQWRPGNVHSPRAADWPAQGEHPSAESRHRRKDLRPIDGRRGGQVGSCAGDRLGCGSAVVPVVRAGEPRAVRCVGRFRRSHRPRPFHRRRLRPWRRLHLLRSDGRPLLRLTAAVHLRHRGQRLRSGRYQGPRCQLLLRHHHLRAVHAHPARVRLHAQRRRRDGRDQPRHRHQRARQPGAGRAVRGAALPQERHLGRADDHQGPDDGLPGDAGAVRVRAAGEAGVGDADADHRRDRDYPRVPGAGGGAPRRGEVPPPEARSGAGQAEPVDRRGARLPEQDVLDGRRPARLGDQRVPGVGADGDAGAAGGTSRTSCSRSAASTRRTRRRPTSRSCSR